MNSSTRKIRQASMGDLEQLLRLLHQLSPPKNEKPFHSAEHVINYMLHDPQYHLNVYLLDDGRLVGTSMLLVQHNFSHGGRPVGHIENVVADEPLRGYGIGKALVENQLRVARERGCYKVILDCSVANTPFYEKCGLHKTGEVEMRIDI